MNTEKEGDVVGVVAVTPQLPRIKGWVYTGEYRSPNEGEYFLSKDEDCVMMWKYRNSVLGRRFIMEKEEPKHWRAGKGSGYYYVTSRGDVDRGFDCNYPMDAQRYSIRNYYKTEEEAQVVADKIKALHTGSPCQGCE